jgi:mono/diheme cytochrome c family protein
VRTAFAIVLVTAAAGVAGAGCGESAGAERARAGHEVYVRECARCHQLDGRGQAGVYPNLAGNPIVTLASPEPAIEIVLEGRGGMPGFGGAVSEQKLSAVVSYVRGAWGNDASPVSPAQVK